MFLSPFVGLGELLGLLVRVFVIVIFINAFSNFIGFHYCLLAVTPQLFSSTVLILQPITLILLVFMPTFQPLPTSEHYSSPSNIFPFIVILSSFLILTLSILFTFFIVILFISYSFLPFLFPPSSTFTSTKIIFLSVIFTFSLFKVIFVSAISSVTIIIGMKLSHLLASQSRLLFVMALTVLRLSFCFRLLSQANYPNLRQFHPPYLHRCKIYCLQHFSITYHHFHFVVRKFVHFIRSPSYHQTFGLIFLSCQSYFVHSIHFSQQFVELICRCT